MLTEKEITAWVTKIVAEVKDSLSDREAYGRVRILLKLLLLEVKTAQAKPKTGLWPL